MRTQQDVLQQNIINHMGIVIDASSSMHRHRGTVVKVIDNLVKHLAARSTQLTQETRISVWMFADRGTERCIVWDIDVLRMPSIASFYEPYGWTALIDGAMLAINDLKEIPTKYGDHSFLLYVVTDGEENSSRATAGLLHTTISKLDDNWTVAALVPDTRGIHDAKRYGFPAGNIDKWDATTREGIEEFGRRLTTVSDNYMTSRSVGTRGTSSLFSMGSDVLNKQSVRAADLDPLSTNEYTLLVVPHDAVIRNFVQDEMGMTWVIGRGYYQLTKRETIQAQKGIAIVEKKTNRVFTGKHARDLLGLPDMEVRVSPEHNDQFDVFVQSTSVNRKLVAGQKFLYLHH